MRAAAVAALLAWSTVSWAHGGLPVSQNILRQNGGDTMYVPVVYWGLWVGQAGGPWRWICEEEINANRFRRWALSTDGMFYTTDSKGITLSSNHGCSWTPATGDIAQLHVTDIVVDPDDGATAYAATGDAGTVLPDGGIAPAVNGVFVTNDHGGTWTALPSLGDQSQRLFTSVRVARTEPHRVLYVTSNAQTTPFTPTLHRSFDGAASFTSTQLSYVLDGATPHALGLLAIDPRNPRVVWARAVADVSNGSTMVTRHGLLRSSDAGATWSEMAKLDAVTDPSGQTRGIDSVAFDLAKGIVYVATRTGLLSANDGGDATLPMLAPTGSLAQTQCVDVHDGTVYACSSQFPPDKAAVAHSSDGAHTFSSVLNYVDTVGPIDTCPADTDVAKYCPDYWYMYGSQLGISFDAGMPGPPPPKSHGCSSVGAGESAVGGVAAAALLVAFALRAAASGAARARRRH
jgi:hypothetical protein